MMASERELVFVYGTLRKGASNHFRMDGAEFVGKAFVRGWLFRVDWYPGLVVDRKGRAVVGELYRVPGELLAALDAFEGCAGGDDDEYERVAVRVKVRGKRGAERAWLWEYRRSRDGREPVPRGDWLWCEFPPRAPLFLAVALTALAGMLLWAFLPSLAGLLPGGFGGVLPWVAGGFPVVVLVAAEISLRRRERGRALGIAALYLGVLGSLAAVLALVLFLVGR